MCKPFRELLTVLMLITIYISARSVVKPRIEARNMAGRVMRPAEWVDAATTHRRKLEELLYPTAQYTRAKSGIKPVTLKKSKLHAVSTNVVFNFLHKYYSFSAERLLRYSPGVGVGLEDIKIDRDTGKRGVLFDSPFLRRHGGATYWEYLPEGVSHKQHDMWDRSKTILAASVLRKPHFSCFGLHEWAMLARGDGQESKHQRLPLRVSQETIDKVVMAKSALRCTHFDAFRFFHPDVAALNQPLHDGSALSRKTQEDHEQPGCLHHTMDVFKYAFQLYPFIPSELLITSLEIALAARRLDMRASPYDTSGEPDVRGPAIPVETAQGRLTYATEQEALYCRSAPLRFELLEWYDRVLAQCSTC